MFEKFYKFAGIEGKDAVEDMEVYWGMMGI